MGFAPEGISEGDGNTGEYQYAWQRMESPGIKRGEMERRFYREIKTVAMGDTDNPMLKTLIQVVNLMAALKCRVVIRTRLLIFKG